MGRMEFVEVTTPYKMRRSFLLWWIQAKAATVWEVCVLLAERDDGGQLVCVEKTTQEEN
jgi:hypothetical protein